MTPETNLGSFCIFANGNVAIKYTDQDFLIENIQYRNGHPSVSHEDGVMRSLLLVLSV